MSDVANAIYDGTDAVMLSAETSIGKYPVEAVKFMARIAAESEASLRSKGYQDPPHWPQPANPEILADAAYHAARDSEAAAIVVFTSTGSSARLVSRYRPPVGVYAITPHDTTARQLAINYGVTPILAPDVSNTDEMLAQMDRKMVDGGHLQRGELRGVSRRPTGRPSRHHQPHEAAPRRHRLTMFRVSEWLRVRPDALPRSLRTKHMYGTATSCSGGLLPGDWHQWAAGWNFQSLLRICMPSAMI